ncbi:hypothetical protein OFC47_23875 [Escherichia coli]|nr:hypothetical protein [Escherichia coli]
MSGFATSDLSVDFCDARQGGGAYGKSASGVAFFGVFVSCLHPLILWITLSLLLSGQIPLAAAERPSVASQ